MRSRKILCILASAVIHSIILGALVYVPEKVIRLQPPPPEKESVVITFIPPVAESTIAEVEETIAEEGSSWDTPPAKYPDKKPSCTGKDKSYEGVGFMFSPGTNTVLLVPRYYPAYKAGLRVGDMITNYIVIINGYIDLDLIRGYTKLHLHIKTDKICYDE